MTLDSYVDLVAFPTQLRKLSTTAQLHFAQRYNQMMTSNRYKEKADGKTYALVGRDAGAALVKSGVQVFKWHKARGSFLFPVHSGTYLYPWEYMRSAHMECWSKRDITRLSTNKLLANQTERALARGTVMFAVEVQEGE
jgi:hypothetical protein